MIEGNAFDIYIRIQLNREKKELRKLFIQNRLNTCGDSFRATHDIILEQIQANRVMTKFSRNQLDKNKNKHFY